jgi:hypothetical protein
VPPAEAATVRHGSRLARRALLAAALSPAAGRAAEGVSLVFLERHDCPHCRRWLRDVGEQAWNRSDLGRRAPLRRVDVAQGLPADLGFIRNWRFTPIFILVQGGRELGRIIGYNGDLFFWQQAEALMGRLPGT